MLQAYTKREVELLSLPVPMLGLPALTNPSVRTLSLRAMDLEWPDPPLFKRSEKSLETLLKIWGAIPATESEIVNSLTEGAMQWKFGEP